MDWIGNPNASFDAYILLCHFHQNYVRLHDKNDKVEHRKGLVSALKLSKQFVFRVSGKRNCSRSPRSESCLSIHSANLSLSNNIRGPPRFQSHWLVLPRFFSSSQLDIVPRFLAHFRRPLSLSLSLSLSLFVVVIVFTKKLDGQSSVSSSIDDDAASVDEDRKKPHRRDFSRGFPSRRWSSFSAFIVARGFDDVDGFLRRR